jgi:hypothetical protein
MPRALEERAYYFTDAYEAVLTFREKHQDYLSYDDLEIERIFNTWLNLESYDRE